MGYDGASLKRGGDISSICIGLVPYLEEHQRLRAG